MGATFDAIPSKIASKNASYIGGQPLKLGGIVSKLPPKLDPRPKNILPNWRPAATVGGQIGGFACHIPGAAGNIASNIRGSAGPPGPKLEAFSGSGRPNWRLFHGQGSRIGGLAG